jgi:hypothetical protein
LVGVLKAPGSCRINAGKAALPEIQFKCWRIGFVRELKEAEL